MDSEPSSVPDMRVERERGEVVIGPWPEFQYDYTVLKIRDLKAFIQDLENLAIGG